MARRARAFLLLPLLLPQVRPPSRAASSPPKASMGLPLRDPVGHPSFGTRPPLESFIRPRAGLRVTRFGTVTSAKLPDTDTHAAYGSASSCSALALLLFTTVAPRARTSCCPRHRGPYLLARGARASCPSPRSLLPLRPPARPCLRWLAGGSVRDPPLPSHPSHAPPPLAARSVGTDGRLGLLSVRCSVRTDVD